MNLNFLHLTTYTSLLTTLYILIIFLILFFNVFLWSSKVNKTQNRYLAVFLLVQCIGIVNHFCHIQFEAKIFTSPHCLYVGRPFYLLYVPTFYLYVKAIVRNHISLKKEIYHFIPFLALTLYLCFTFYFRSAPIKLEMHLSNNVLTLKQEQYLSHLTYVLMFIYLISSLLLLKKYHKKLQNTESKINKLTHWWLRSFIFYYMAGCILSALFTYNIPFLLSIKQMLFLIMMLVFFLFYCFIVYNALFHPELFGHFEEPVKYKTSTLSDYNLKNYSKKLTDYIEKEKPYLNPDLRISDLSKSLSISQWHLSQVINQTFNQTFFDYINSYRIAEAKRLFESKNESYKTILEVIYAVGFNSKSSFNNAFKKHEGTTPSEYKKRLLL